LVIHARARVALSSFSIDIRSILQKLGDTAPKWTSEKGIFDSRQEIRRHVFSREWEIFFELLSAFTRGVDLLQVASFMLENSVALV
jgi:hypothetical protein